MLDATALDIIFRTARTHRRNHVLKRLGVCARFHGQRARILGERLAHNRADERRLVYRGESDANGHARQTN